MLSALVSELPPRSPMTEALSIFAIGALSVGLELGSLVVLRLALSELSTGVLDSESLVVGNFGLVVDMLGLVLLRDAIELGAA